MDGEGATRLLISLLFLTLFGYLYYNEVSPAGAKWIAENYAERPNITFSTDDIPRCLGLTVGLQIVLGSLINFYVEGSRNSLTKLVQMGVQLWLMTVTLSAHHVLWSKRSLCVFGIDVVWDLIVIMVLTFGLAFKRGQMNVHED